MSFTDRIKQSKNQQEAMLVLAQGLDEILGALRTTGSRQETPETWGAWEELEVATGHQPGVGAPSSPGPDPSGTQPLYEPIIIPVDPVNVVLREADYEQAIADFERLRLTGDKAATVAAAQRIEGMRGRLDLARNPGAILPEAGMVGAAPDSIIRVEESPTDVIYDIPVASEEIKVARRALAERVDLPGAFPVVQRQTPEAIQEIIENYVKLGPLWLYLGDQEGRKMIMSLPIEARREMLMDVDATTHDARFTHEFGRDIMKEEDEGDVEYAKKFTWQMSDHGGEPLGGSIPAPSMD